MNIINELKNLILNKVPENGYKKKILKLVILDINLRSLGGHGYSYNSEIANSAKNKFTKTVIYHHPLFNAPKSKLNLKKLSCLIFYNKLENLNKKNISNIKNKKSNLKGYFITELKFFYKFLNAIYYSFVVLFKENSFKCKTNFFYQHPLIEDIFAIFILAKLIKYISFVNIRFSVVLRNTIEEITRGNKKKSFIFKYLKKCQNIDLYTDSDLLTDHYNQFFKTKNVTTLPIPISLPKNIINILPKNRGIFSIGCLGPPRFDKGFLLMPNVIRNLIDKNNEFKINLYIQIDKVMDKEINETYKKIKEISENSKNKFLNIKFLQGPLSQKAYQSNFKNMDLILILYNHERYKLSTSGIFAESLVLNVPTLCWEDSWASHFLNEARLKKLTIGEQISDTNKTFDLVKKIKLNTKSYKIDLDKFLVHWSKKNNFKEIAQYFLKNM